MKNIFYTSNCFKNKRLLYIYFRYRKGSGMISLLTLTLGLDAALGQSLGKISFNKFQLKI